MNLDEYDSIIWFNFHVRLSAIFARVREWFDIAVYRIRGRERERETHYYERITAEAVLQ